MFRCRIYIYNKTLGKPLIPSPVPYCVQNGSINSHKFTAATTEVVCLTAMTKMTFFEVGNSAISRALVSSTAPNSNIVVSVRFYVQAILTTVMGHVCVALWTSTQDLLSDGKSAFTHMTGTKEQNNKTKY